MAVHSNSSKVDFKQFVIDHQNSVRRYDINMQSIFEKYDKQIEDDAEIDLTDLSVARRCDKLLSRKTCMFGHSKLRKTKKKDKEKQLESFCALRSDSGEDPIIKHSSPNQDTYIVSKNDDTWNSHRRAFSPVSSLDEISSKADTLSVTYTHNETCNDRLNAETFQSLNETYHDVLSNMDYNSDDMSDAETLTTTSESSASCDDDSDEESSNSSDQFPEFPSKDSKSRSKTMVHNQCSPDQQYDSTLHLGDNFRQKSSSHQEYDSDAQNRNCEQYRHLEDNIRHQSSSHQEYDSALENRNSQRYCFPEDNFRQKSSSHQEHDSAVQSRNRQPYCHEEDKFRHQRSSFQEHDRSVQNRNCQQYPNDNLRKKRSSLQEYDSTAQSRNCQPNYHPEDNFRHQRSSLLEYDSTVQGRNHQQYPKDNLRHQSSSLQEYDRTVQGKSRQQHRYELSRAAHEEYGGHLSTLQEVWKKAKNDSSIPFERSGETLGSSLDLMNEDQDSGYLSSELKYYPVENICRHSRVHKQYRKMQPIITSDQVNNYLASGDKSLVKTRKTNYTAHMKTYPEDSKHHLASPTPSVASDITFSRTSRWSDRKKCDRFPSKPSNNDVDRKAFNFSSNSTFEDKDQIICDQNYQRDQSSRKERLHMSPLKRNHNCNIQAHGSFGQSDLTEIKGVSRSQVVNQHSHQNAGESELIEIKGLSQSPDVKSYSRLRQNLELNSRQMSPLGQNAELKSRQMSSLQQHAEFNSRQMSSLRQHAELNSRQMSSIEKVTRWIMPQEESDLSNRFKLKAKRKLKIQSDMEEHHHGVTSEEELVQNKHTMSDRNESVQNKHTMSDRNQSARPTSDTVGCMFLKKCEAKKTCFSDIKDCSHCMIETKNVKVPPRQYRTSEGYKMSEGCHVHDQIDLTQSPEKVSYFADSDNSRRKQHHKFKSDISQSPDKTHHFFRSDPIKAHFSSPKNVRHDISQSPNKKHDLFRTDPSAICVTSPKNVCHDISQSPNRIHAFFRSYPSKLCPTSSKTDFVENSQRFISMHSPRASKMSTICNSPAESPRPTSHVISTDPQRLCDSTQSRRSSCPILNMDNSYQSPQPSCRMINSGDSPSAVSSSAVTPRSSRSSNSYSPSTALSRIHLASPRKRLNMYDELTFFEESNKEFTRMENPWTQSNDDELFKVPEQIPYRCRSRSARKEDSNTHYSRSYAEDVRKGHPSNSGERPSPKTQILTDIDANNTKGYKILPSGSDSSFFSRNKHERNKIMDAENYSAGIRKGHSRSHSLVSVSEVAKLVSPEHRNTSHKNLKKYIPQTEKLNLMRKQHKSSPSHGMLQSTPRKANDDLMLSDSLSTINPNSSSSEEDDDVLLIR